MGQAYSSIHKLTCVERDQARAVTVANARYVVYFTDGVKQAFADNNWHEFLEHTSYSCSIMKGIDVPLSVRTKYNIHPKQVFFLYIPEGCLHLELNSSFYPFRGNLVLVALYPFHCDDEIADVSDLLLARLNHFQTFATI